MNNGEKSPKISVCIPAYNSELWIAEAIESIESQTFTDWEIVVMDDCSTDGTSVLLDFFKKKHGSRFNWFHTTGHNGIAHARNCANQIARGEIICVQDSDDYSQKMRLEKTWKYFKRHKNVDLVYGAYQMMNSRGIPQVEVPAEDFDFDRLKKHNFISHPTVAYRKKAALDVKYREECKVLDDWFFYYDFHNKGYKIGKMDDTIAFYRVIPTSVSHSEEKKKEVEEMRAKFLKEASEHNRSLVG